jgi:diguanylate cyclase (GGDEF)-like protein
MQDELTGLANRRRFELGLRARRGTGRVCIALLDLNGFKNVNDDLGHDVGDRLLVEVAARLTRAVGDAGSVARMGGDEFAVLLPGATDAVAVMVVDRIARCLVEPIRVGEHELVIGASIGLARGADITESHEAMRRADIAMYAAKEGGEPHRWYTPELDRRASEEARLGAELRTALEADQLRLVYQPIVELPLGRVVAVEALLRWHHPDRGLISPADFIPIAERNGMIVELGAWVLRQACRQAARWRAERGAEVPERVSVNVSARQLTRPGLAAVVASALAETGLPATCLTIEVTETAVFDAGHALTVLHELRTLA